MSEAPGTDRESSRVHVVAAILVDARGRILLSRRTDGRDLAGLWEFPGGKIEAGESPEQALARELREELGIEIGASTPLIAVPHAYPHKRILLDVRRVASYRGRPRGLERQALTWVTRDRLSDYAMPAADRPVVAALQQSERYLITPEPGEDDVRFLRELELALATGVRRVQLRTRSIAAPRARVLAQACRTRIESVGGELWLNAAMPDSAALARELDCGLHLTSGLLRAQSTHPTPSSPRLAASCHDTDELQLAQALGCDFAVLGPVCRTPTHPEAAPLGWSGFARLRESVALPIYALGGLSHADLPMARAHGAQGIAAIRGLWPVNPAAG